MTPDGIRAAFAPFVEMLRRGGFVRPNDGWPAEYVAAHVALNNDAFTEVAEKVRRGEPAAYTNEVAVDDDTLRGYVAATGGLAELADAVERSADRLATARAALSDDEAATEVPLRIRHAGTVVRDSPGRLGQWMEGAATFHVDMHVEQLRALLPAGSGVSGPA